MGGHGGIRSIGSGDSPHTVLPLAAATRESHGAIMVAIGGSIDDAKRPPTDKLEREEIAERMRGGISLERFERIEENIDRRERGPRLAGTRVAGSPPRDRPRGWPIPCLSRHIEPFEFSVVSHEHRDEYLAGREAAASATAHRARSMESDVHDGSRDQRAEGLRKRRGDSRDPSPRAQGTSKMAPSGHDEGRAG